MSEFEMVANTETSQNGAGQNDASRDEGNSKRPLFGASVLAPLFCPNCAKTYQMTDPQEGLVYQCQRCQTQFMVRWDNHRFLAVPWSEQQILKILFEMPGQTGPSQMARAWKEVFENLEDMKAHENFIRVCQSKNNLALAKEKYKQLSIYLNWQGLSDELKAILEPQMVKPSPWHERGPWILLGLAGLFIVFGTFLPGQRNMVGAGVLLLILNVLIYRKQMGFGRAD
jgi:hypothetical protein